MHKAAVIGTGYIGVVHIEQLMRLPSVQIAGIMDRNSKLVSGRKIVEVMADLKTTLPKRTMHRNT